jgi:hypothetical protein
MLRLHQPLPGFRDPVRKKDSQSRTVCKSDAEGAAVTKRSENMEFKEVTSWLREEVEMI